MTSKCVQSHIAVEDILINGIQSKGGRKWGFHFPLCKNHQSSISSAITPLFKADTSPEQRQEDAVTNIQIIPSRTRLMQCNYITRVSQIQAATHKTFPSSQTRSRSQTSCGSVRRPTDVGASTMSRCIEQEWGSHFPYRLSSTDDMWPGKRTMVLMSARTAYTAICPDLGYIYIHVPLKMAPQCLFTTMTCFIPTVVIKTP